MLLVEDLVAADDEGSPLIGCGIANRHLASDVDLVCWVALDDLGIVLHLDVLLEAVRERPFLALLLLVAEIVVPRLSALVGPKPLLLPGFPQSACQLLDLCEERVVVFAQEAVGHGCGPP